MSTPDRPILRIDRRQFLKLGGIAAVVFAAGGLACAPQPPLPATPDRRNPTPTAAAKPTQEPEITSYYPELKNYQVRTKGEFTTGQTHTKWFNLSKMDFNPNTASAVLAFFESLGKNQGFISYLYNNQDLPFALDQRPRTERVIFFIPQKAPSPDWPNVALNAATTERFTNGPYVTFVRIPDSGKDVIPSSIFTTPELTVNKAFTVEACQSSIQVYSFSAEIAYLGQEIICNSYGAAFTLKQTNLSFREYQSWAKAVLVRQDPKSPSYPLYVLSEQEYNQIPQVGQILK